MRYHDKYIHAMALTRHGRAYASSVPDYPPEGGGFKPEFVLMKFRLSILFALSLMFFCAEILAQGVYVTRDKNGPVFSDKPQAGSRELKLPPLTVIPAVPTSGPNKAQSPSVRPDARQTEREPPEVIAPYRSLTVIAPADGISVAGDVSLLEVRLAVDPPLLRAEGHAFVVLIDGRSVDQYFTSTEFLIPPGFWPDRYMPSNQRMQLDAAIVDRSGQILMRAPSVHFRSLPVILQPQPYPVRPGYRPPPKETRPAAPPKKTGNRVQGKGTSKAWIKKD
ncbi:hypothetical protein AGMMS50256_27970 [Betaproteobacteria bacterium]|nr:hypothetical protein AGMMS50256_27970 [Betaproteobacteria bacterium]